MPSVALGSSGGTVLTGGDSAGIGDQLGFTFLLIGASSSAIARDRGELGGRFLTGGDSAGIGED